MLNEEDNNRMMIGIGQLSLFHKKSSYVLWGNLLHIKDDKEKAGYLKIPYEKQISNYNTLVYNVEP